MKKKIIYLFTSCKNKGPTKQTLNIIKHLDREIFEPILVTLYKDAENDTLLDEFKLLIERCYSIDSSSKKVLLRSKKNIFKVLDEIEPDIIHSVGLVPAIVAQKYTKSIHVTTIRNFVYDDYVSKFGKATGTIMAKIHLSIIQKCTHVYACSQSLSNLYKEAFSLDLPYIRNGVDVKNYPLKSPEDTVRFREKLGLPFDKLILIYTGQFIMRKNQQFAIENFLALSSDNAEMNAVMLLLGDGADYKELYAKYSHNEAILFTGNVSNVSEYLQASDIYLSTSKSEGLPNGVLEAMATGLPVLLSDILQHKEIHEINENVGFLYELGNSEDFQHQLTMLLDEDLKTMGSASYNVINNELNAKKMSITYQREYQKALGMKI